jgi:hypothetical protein
MYVIKSCPTDEIAERKLLIRFYAAIKMQAAP